MLITIIPIFSLRSLWSINKINLAESSQAEVMKHFVKEKRRFWIVQKTGLYLSFLLLLTIIPPMAELAGSPPISQKPWFWWIYPAIGIVFLIFFVRFITSSYKKSLKDSESLIQTLE